VLKCMYTQEEVGLSGVELMKVFSMVAARVPKVSKTGWWKKPMGIVAWRQCCWAGRVWLGRTPQMRIEDWMLARGPGNKYLTW
jgi:hypothetical protein